MVVGIRPEKVTVPDDNTVVEVDVFKKVNCVLPGLAVTNTPYVGKEPALLVALLMAMTTMVPDTLCTEIAGAIGKLTELVENLSTNNILYFQTKGLTIKNNKHAPFHIDGEPKETAAEFNIEIIPSCFNLIQP